MALRLTLRTLLAYLDDTLQASEIKEIGQKVSESDAAQELIARIKQVTRRRRLTVPPTSGPNSMDPNDVSEYLDNVLASEQISDVEKHALESDVHLAEIAACHQILTLVLGEPALVPPKARERMYNLVKGRETIPYRKAQPAKLESAGALEDENSLALSMGWMRWVLPVAGVLLLGALGLAIYQILPDRNRDNSSLGPNRPKVPDDLDDQKKDKAKAPDKDPVVKDKPIEKTPDKLPIVKTPLDKDPPQKEVRNPVEVERSLPPTKTRVGVGNFVGTVAELPLGVVTRADDKSEWQMARPSSKVFSRDTYVALPGFAGFITTTSGVGVLVRGQLRESATGVLLESAVVLHANDKFDLDLTLLRGRVFLTNRKGSPVKIRLRFQSEIWDVALANKGDEIVVDLWQYFTPAIDWRAGEAPRAHGLLGVLRGDAELKINAYDAFNIEVEGRKWVRVEYDSFTKTTGPIKEQSLWPAMSKQLPSPDLLPENQRGNLQKMKAALKDMEALLSTRKSPVVALQETLDKNDPASRLLAVYCLAALDEVGKIIDVLSDEDLTHLPDREAALYALQRWISRGAGQDKILYDEKTGMGLLIDKKFKKREAERMLKLLHPFLTDEIDKVITYQDLASDLEHSKIAIAEMAFWNLAWISPGVKFPPNFNAAAPVEDRERYAAEIQKMIDKKILPPIPATADKTPAVAEPEKKDKP